MKKYLCVIPLLVLLCFVIGCQDKAAMADLEKYKAQAALEEQNKAVVLRFLDAMQKRDIEALKETLSPDYVWRDLSGENGTREDNLEGLKWQMSAFPDMAYSNEHIFAKGDLVVHRWTFRGTHTGGDKDLPATGKKVAYMGISIQRVENGKIVEEWEAADTMSLYDQLGYEMKPKEEKKK
jgi:steroid delta-isomerase-like uncharacterized protein